MLTKGSRAVGVSLTGTQRVERVVREMGGEVPRDLLVTWLAPTMGRRDADLAVRLAAIVGLVDVDEHDVVRVSR